MIRAARLAIVLVVALASACGGGGAANPDAAGASDGAADGAFDAAIDASPGAADARPDAGDCGTPTACAALWEQQASDRYDSLQGDPLALADFLRAVPKGGDLHNHLNGAVYAETYLEWARADGDCINSTTYAAVGASGCSTSTMPAPSSGAFFDAIVRAWSMQDFVAGTQSGHDHFFATFGKYGTIAGLHRDESLADIVTRAYGENQLYIETMFNLGKNTGTLAASLWSGTLTQADLPTLYASLTTNAGFTTAVTSDVNVVNSATTGLATALDCNGLSPPDACGVTVRFIAQVSRTGANDQIFGQLVGAFEMASRTSGIVGVNLSSPEDDTASINNYKLHMAMLDFLYAKYTATGASPLHITLHAGELTAAYLPTGSTANTFHIRDAVEVAHAERIGHGLDVMSETDPTGLLDEMAQKNVLVEVCLSSNDQILEVKGADHPLAQYLAHGVPVALATDDQGVSRSSLAGEYLKAALDQHLDYRQLKTVARQSLEHAFLPGASLWTAVGTAPVAACAPTDTMGVGDPANTACADFLAQSERARMQWELEHRFRVFEQQQ
ncbi:MAG: adenosine deaminase [Deltaproteobacteria bacterium]|nr:adenosine deaminase [Deltaproteobacteria bacterium]